MYVLKLFSFDNKFAINFITGVQKNGYHKGSRKVRLNKIITMLKNCFLYIKTIDLTCFINYNKIVV